MAASHILSVEPERPSRRSETQGRAAASTRVARAIIGFGEQTDHRLMIRVNHWRAPQWLRLWMIAATRCGDGWLWYATGAMVGLFGGRDRWAAVLSAVA